MLKIKNFILTDQSYPYKYITSQYDSFFQIHDNINHIITDFFVNKKSNTEQCNFFYQREEDQSMTMIRSYKTEIDFIDCENKIFIGKDSLLETTAHIKPNTIILNHCEVRHGAYIRGSFIAGQHSVIGHTTEIKNSIFGEHVEAGHFAYIGDSIIGSFVNLGAGTILSNLEFRTLQQKQSQEFPKLNLKLNQQEVEHQKNKFGAVIGDGCETGCNAVLAPFTFLEAESHIYPNTFVSKGLYKKKSKIISSEIARKIKN